MANYGADWLHGIEMKEIKESMGGTIQRVSSSIIAIVAKGVKKESYKEDKYYLLKSKEDLDEIFEKETPLYKYISAIFMESGGYIAARATSENPSSDDIDYMYKASVETGKNPKIFISPGTEHVQNLNIVAEKSGGIAILDISPVNDINTLNQQTNSCSYHVYGFLDSGLGLIPGSAATAGLIRSVDEEQGFWISPSNKIFKGVRKIGTVVQWSLDDKLSSANELNKKHITPFISNNGIRPWGNRLGSGDFINVYRVKKSISESIQNSIQWAIDSNIGKALLTVVLETVNNYLRDLKGQGAILGGSCTAPLDKNTAEKIKEGSLTLDFEFTPCYPAEMITFRYKITDLRLKEILS